MKRIIFALIIFMMAIGAAAAGDVNSTDDMISQVATDDDAGSEDALAMTDDFFEETDDEPDDFSNSNLEIVEKDLKSDSKYLKIKLSNRTDNAPIAGVDLGVITSDVLTSDDWHVEKITTDLDGIATYNIPFRTGSKSIAVGLYLEYGDSGGMTNSNDVVKVSFLKTKITIENFPAKLSLEKSGDSYKDTILTVTLLDDNRKAVANEEVSLKFSNGIEKKVKTDSNGKAKYTLPFKPGKYSVTVKVLSNEVDAKDVTMNNIKIKKASAKLAPAKLKTTYQSGKAFKVKVTNAKSKHAIEGVALILKVYTGSKSKKYTVTTDSKGTASFDASKLSIGSHKIVASVKDSKCVSAKSKSSSAKISKAALRISAPEVTNVYKSGTFRVTVANKESGKAMGGVKVAVKVYTGSKYKTYSAKTNSRGEASISTKSLSKATHNVAVNVKATSNYKSASARSSIQIINQRYDTHFALDNLITTNNLAGVFDSALITVKLFDSRGNELNGHGITAQIKVIDSRRNVLEGSDLESGYSGSSILLNVKSGYGGYSNRYIEVHYAGSAYYNACTSQIRF